MCDTENTVSAEPPVEKMEANTESETKPVALTLEPELEQKIIKQVEFYFGDINLSRDKFLQEQLKLDDAWVTLKVLLTFNRLKVLCSDEATVAAVLRKSTSGLLEVSEDNTKIRRSVEKPLPAASKEQLDGLRLRSIYAKEFPLDSTLDQLIEFFEKFGKTEVVLMRKDAQRAFKGSCFVVYETTEDTEKFLKEPNLKFNDVELTARLYKHEYFAGKANSKKTQQAERAQAKEQLRAKAEAEELSNHMVSGAVLKVENVPKETTVENIREFFNQFGEVKWVDLNKDENGETQTRVRFLSTDGAKNALEKAKTEATEGKIVFKDVELNCSVLEGEAEVEHWKNLIQTRKDRKFKDGGNNRKFKRNFGGKKECPPWKRQKREANNGGGGRDSD